MTPPQLPYVYILEHISDHTFYIGMRSANKLPAEEDLGQEYFSSSSIVKENFENFESKVLAIFFKWEDAFLFENALIEEQWGNPLMLNKHYQKNSSTFSMKGFKRKDVSERNKQLKTLPKENRNYNCSYCDTELSRIEFCHHDPKKHYYCDATCRNRYIAENRKEPKVAWNKGLRKKKKPKLPRGEKNKGKKIPNHVRKKISDSCKGRTPWNKGKKYPKAAENGKRGAKTQSEKVTGRKRFYRADGSWTWQYPRGDGTYYVKEGTT